MKLKQARSPRWKASSFRYLRRPPSYRAGFTLIELLVVIAIIGLLASVVLVSLNSARAKSRDAKRAADAKQFASALELFFNDCSGYPATAQFSNAMIASTPRYMANVPTAPTPPDGSCGTGNTYTYAASGSAFASPNSAAACQLANVNSAYTLTFCLGANTGGYIDGTDGGSDVNCTLSPTGISCL